MVEVPRGSWDSKPMGGSEPGTLIRRQANEKQEGRRGAKGKRAAHQGELLG